MERDRGRRGLGAPGRYGREMCPGERNTFNRAKIRPIRNNQPICVLERGSPMWDMNSAYT